MKFKLTMVMVSSLLMFGAGCKKKESPTTTTTPGYLYVASGLCYSGTGNTTFTAATASNIIYRLSLDTGAVDSIVTDYTIASETAGNTPTAIVNYDDDNILVMVENSTTAAGRKIEKVPKVSGTEKSIYYTNATALSTALRAMTLNLTDGTVLISKTTAVEKINATPARMTIGASTPWISNPAGNCTTSATYISSLQTLTNGKILYTHANTAQNKIGMISAAGYTAASDCVISATVSAPTALAFPTASVYIPAYNQYLVLYAGNATTTDLNSIYAYDVNESTSAVTGATRAYQDSTVLYGGSAITYDSSTGYVYVATANGTSTTVGNYNIEKFSYDPTAKALKRIGNVPFSTGWTGSKCISSMFVDPATTTTSTN